MSGNLTYHGQNLEDKIIHEYFGNYKGMLFDIGANSGTFLSNSLALINLGWEAHLFEPGSVYTELEVLHGENSRVRLNNFGLSDKNETLTFWESENHVPGGTDSCLVSTTIFEETKRWPNVVFHENTIRLTSFEDYWAWVGRPQIDFISLDVEGMEMQILKAINLTAVRCSALCVEWNGVPELKVQFEQYCNSHGLKLAYANSENLIFLR